jgi:hypothetical protein
VIIRKFLIIELGIIKKNIYDYSHKQSKWFSPGVIALFSNKGYLCELIIEVLIVSIHPNVATMDLFFTMYDQDYSMNITHSINNILGMLMLLKYYIVLRALIALTKFGTTRA